MVSKSVQSVDTISKQISFYAKEKTKCFDSIHFPTVLPRTLQQISLFILVIGNQLFKLFYSYSMF
jgi:hypothetical protein